MTPDHWRFLDYGEGVHGTCVELAQFFVDELELGERVATYLDAEAIKDWP